jgi:UDP-N-acetylglucosamine:LPS N-acetylglucosamine transferase
MKVKASDRRAKVLAVASSGGHWAQLLRIMPALDSSEVAFVTVLESYRSQVPDNRFYCVNDANRWNKMGLVVLAVRMTVIVARERPDVVISTGAAPGFFALWFGRLFGARTIWIDSITNIERLSMSGSLAGRHADLWLTQWPHLARPEGPHFGGAIL